MADGSIRIIIDLIGGTSSDMKTAMDLKSEDTTMILAKTEDINSTVDEETH